MVGNSGSKQDLEEVLCNQVSTRLLDVEGGYSRGRCATDFTFLASTFLRLRLHVLR